MQFKSNAIHSLAAIWKVPGKDQNELMRTELHSVFPFTAQIHSIILLTQSVILLVTTVVEGPYFLASGVGVGQCPRRQNFALEIPTCWYILALPNAKICVIPDAKPQRQPVKYSLCWVLGVESCVGHVHFIFFVSISFALGSVFPVEYGL